MLCSIYACLLAPIWLLNLALAFFCSFLLTGLLAMSRVFALAAAGGSGGGGGHDGSEPAATPPVPQKRRFLGCDLVGSLNPSTKGRTYIGFTVNPTRRLRQHNGELKNGKFYDIVYGVIFEFKKKRQEE